MALSVHDEKLLSSGMPHHHRHHQEEDELIVPAEVIEENCGTYVQAASKPLSPPPHRSNRHLRSEAGPHIIALIGANSD